MGNKINDFIKHIVKLMIYRNRASSNTYAKYLMKKGCKIGENVLFHVPESTVIDITRPCLIDIGNNVDFSSGVTVLTHGYDWIVLIRKYGNAAGSAGKVHIKDNVFVGANATILKGITIGNNVIIGANSVVTHDVPDDVVVAGNPARVIMGLDAYHEKRLEAREREAKLLAIQYYERFGRTPPVSVFDEFTSIFRDNGRDIDKPKYNDFDAFLDSIDFTCN